MAEAVSRQRWPHTSAVMCVIANCHRDLRKKPTPYRPADFSSAYSSIGDEGENVNRPARLADVSRRLFYLTLVALSPPLGRSFPNLATDFLKVPQPQGFIYTARDKPTAVG